MELPTRAGWIALALFAGLLLLALVPLVWSAARWEALLAAFYRSGALVFGGGHVVLPLLERAFVAPGWVGQASFLTGYGAAQAMPGPLFTFGAYLGAVMGAVTALPGRAGCYALLGLAGIFLPGLLAMAAVLPFWTRLRGNMGFRAALVGVNASVVGILAAALVHPLWTSTVHSIADVAIAVAAFVALQLRAVQPWMVVAAAVVLAMVL